jgi:hypothetical protein
MALTKNLANCTPREFLTQTNKLRKSAEKWLKVTDVMNIRKNVPQIQIPDGATPEEVSKIMDKHKKELSERAKSNFSEILDSILEKHPDETLELLALICFVEPENVNDYKMTEYLTNITEILSDEAVISFFTSLMRLEQTGISIA